MTEKVKLVETVTIKWVANGYTVEITRKEGWNTQRIEYIEPTLKGAIRRVMAEQEVRDQSTRIDPTTDTADRYLAA